MASPVAGNNNTSISAVLKRWYKDDGLTVATYRDRPYWFMINKKPDSTTIGGSTFQWALQTGDIQARNTVFAAAQSQAWGLSGYGATNALTNSVAGPQSVGGVQIIQFSVTRAYNYSYASINTELQLSSETNRGAFAKMLDKSIDSAMNTLGNDMEISLFGGSLSPISGGQVQIPLAGSGVIAAIGSATSVSSSAGDLYTSNASDCQRFQSQQELDLYYNNSGVLTKRTNVTGSGLFVGSVDYNQGILYIVNSSGSPVAITSVFSNAAVGDFICVTNDMNQGASTLVGQATGKITGFEGWVPFGGPVNDSAANPFMGVNRNTGNIVRNAGNWLDATGVIGPNAGVVLNLEDTLITSVVQIRKNSDKKTTDFAMSWDQFQKLQTANQNRLVIVDNGDIETNEPNLSFDGMRVRTIGGVARVMPSRYCGANRVYALHMPSWSYVHLGADPVKVYSLDGMRTLREPMIDAQGIRFFSFGQTVCDEPSANLTANVPV